MTMEERRSLIVAARLCIALGLIVLSDSLGFDAASKIVAEMSPTRAAGPAIAAPGDRSFVVFLGCQAPEPVRIKYRGRTSEDAAKNALGDYPRCSLVRVEPDAPAVSK